MRAAATVRAAQDAAMNATPSETSSESESQDTSSEGNNMAQLHLPQWQHLPVERPPVPAIHADDTEFISLAVLPVRFVGRILPINWAEVVIDRPFR